MERIACITIVLCFYPSFVQGVGKIVVNPNPAIIYNGATPGTAVLSVKAYDTETNRSLSNVALTNSQDSSYFKLIQEKIPSEWILQVKQTIDKPVDYQFMFSVYGYLQQEPQDRRILINVTQVNLHAPSFEKTEYNFLALRNGMDYNLTDIGYVKAIDLDNELYNKQFHYHILHAEDNFAIDLETGLIEMTHNLPPDIDNVTFSVTAIDGGSPQRLNTTTVVIKITDSPRNAVCPVGFQPHGDSCYHFSIDTEDFPGAMTMCREFGAYLVEINSADENNYLVGQSRAKGASFWIGLSDLLQPGTYMWMESKVVWNKATDYSNWHPGQPDNNDENCVNLEDTLDWDWNDLTCHDNERYICEMKNEENQVIG